MNDRLEQLRALVAAAKSGGRADIGSIERLAAQLLDGGDVSQATELCELLLDAARVLFVHGETANALDIAEATHELCKRRLDESDVLSPLSSITVSACAIDLGNAALSMEVLADALRWCENHEHNGSIYIKILTNLAATFPIVGLFDRLYELNVLTIEMVDGNESHRPLVQMAQRNLAFCCLKQGKYEEGLDWIARSESVDFPDEPLIAIHQNHNRVLGLHFKFQLLVKLSRIREAAILVPLIEKFAALAGNGQRSAAFAKVDRAMLTAYMGDHRAGVRALEALLSSFVEAAGLIPARREVYSALIDLHEYAGDSAGALRYSELLLEDLREASSARASRMAQRSLQKFTVGLQTGARPLGNVEYLSRLQELTRSYADKVAVHERFVMMVEGLERLTVAASLREDEGGSRPYRIGQMTLLLASEVGLGADVALHYGIAARLHDIGKTAIPDFLILKTGVMAEHEKLVLHSHAESGARMLLASKVPEIGEAVDMARYHHERWDGGGYPSGLAGENIPIAARIVAIADAFDAMTHVRCYRSATPLSVEQALVEIAEQSGRAFDPALCACFVTLVRRLASEHDDLMQWLGREADNSSFNRAKATIWASLKRASERGPGQTGPHQAVPKESSPVLAR